MFMCTVSFNKVMKDFFLPLHPFLARTSHIHWLSYSVSICQMVFTNANLAFEDLCSLTSLTSSLKIDLFSPSQSVLENAEMLDTICLCPLMSKSSIIRFTLIPRSRKSEFSSSFDCVAYIKCHDLIIFSQNVWIILDSYVSIKQVT